MRSVHVPPSAVDADAFRPWPCERLTRERDRVQREAARVAYRFDERWGNNVIALGLGVSVFWPALLAMRPAGDDRQRLADLKGRDEALGAALAARACPPAPPAALLAPGAPVAPGDRLVYEWQEAPRAPVRRQAGVVEAGTGVGFAWREPARPESAAWQFDGLGNVLQAPAGYVWPRLIREELHIGGVLDGELVDATDAQARARVRGQVVAIGPQTISGRVFDAAVIELFGDAAATGQASARLEGALVVDRKTGLPLRLDLYGPTGFRARWRLTAIEPALARP